MLHTLQEASKNKINQQNTEVICWDSLIQLLVQWIPLKLIVNLSEKNYQYEVGYCINPPRSIQEQDTKKESYGIHFRKH